MRWRDELCLNGHANNGKHFIYTQSRQVDKTSVPYCSLNTLRRDYPRVVHVVHCRCHCSAGVHNVQDGTNPIEKYLLDSDFANILTTEYHKTVRKFLHEFD
jgi:hypothetical protein